MINERIGIEAHAGVCSSPSKASNNITSCYVRRHGRVLAAVTLQLQCLLVLVQLLDASVGDEHTTAAISTSARG